MRNILILFLCLLTVACGDKSSNRVTVGSLNLQNAPLSQKVDVAFTQTIDEQTGYLTNLGTMTIENKSGSPLKVEKLVGTFDSSNPNLSLVSHRLLIDGEFAGPGFVNIITTPRTLETIDINAPLSPGQKIRIDLLARGAALSSSGTLNMDTFFFDAEGLFIDGQKLQIQFPIINVNSGGTSSNTLLGIYTGVPAQQSASSTSIQVHREQLFNGLNSTQTLYDLHIRFQPGLPGQALNSKLEGDLQLFIDGQLMQTIPVGKMLIPEMYKLNLFKEQIGPFESKTIELFLTNHNCLPGDVIILDRISVGSNFGININTILGTPITCN